MMPDDQSDARAHIAVLDKKTLTPTLLFEIKRSSGAELWNAALQNARRIMHHVSCCFTCNVFF